MRDFWSFILRYMAVALVAGLLVAAPVSFLLSSLLSPDIAIGASFLFGMLVGGLAPMFFIDRIAG